MEFRPKIALFLALTFALALAPGVSAQNGAKPERIQLGYEVEVNGQRLANVVRFLDLNHLSKAIRELQPDLLSESAMAEYPLNLAARAELPRDVQDFLLKDLQFEKDELVLRAPNSPPPLPPRPVTGGSIRLEGIDRPAILGTDGKPLSAGPVLLRANSPNNVSAGEELGARRAQSMNGVLLSREERARILLARWNSLPLEKRRDLVQFKHLSPLAIGRMIGLLPAPMKSAPGLAPFVIPRKDAPEWLKNATLTLDGGSFFDNKPANLEIALKGVETDPEKFLANLDQMKRDVGIATQIDTPLLLERSNVAFHLHVSFPDVRANYEEVFARWKSLAALRFYEAGPQYAGFFARESEIMAEARTRQRRVEEIRDNATDSSKRRAATILGSEVETEARQTSMILYEKSLHAHEGIINIRDANHVEIKLHWADPRAEIEEIQKFLNMPKKQALAAVNAEIEKKLRQNPGFIIFLLEKNPAYVTDFIPAGPEGNAVRTQLFARLRESLSLAPHQESERNLDVYIRRSIENRASNIHSVFADLEKIAAGQDVTRERFTALLLAVGQWDPAEARFAEATAAMAKEWDTNPMAAHLLEGYWGSLMREDPDGTWKTVKREPTLRKKIDALARDLLKEQSAARSPEQVARYLYRSYGDRVPNGSQEWKDLIEVFFELVDRSQVAATSTNLLHHLIEHRAGMREEDWLLLARSFRANAKNLNNMTEYKMWTELFLAQGKLPDAVLETLADIAFARSESVINPHDVTRLAYYAQVVGAQEPRPPRYADIYAELLRLYAKTHHLKFGWYSQTMLEAFDDVPVDLSKVTKEDLGELRAAFADSSPPDRASLHEKILRQLETQLDDRTPATQKPKAKGSNLRPGDRCRAGYAKAKPRNPSGRGPSEGH